MKLRFSFLIALCLAVSMILSIWLQPVGASSSLVNSRINQLEFQVRSLQTQINQLQGQASRPSSVGAPVRSDSGSGIGSNIGTVPGDLSLDEQFDNLATLVIEINQRVAALEASQTR